MADLTIIVNLVAQVVRDVAIVDGALCGHVLLIEGRPHGREGI